MTKNNWITKILYLYIFFKKKITILHLNNKRNKKKWKKIIYLQVYYLQDFLQVNLIKKATFKVITYYFEITRIKQIFLFKFILKN